MNGYQSTSTSFRCWKIHEAKTTAQSNGGAGRLLAKNQRQRVAAVDRATGQDKQLS